MCQWLIEKYRNRMENRMTEFQGFYPETIDFLWGIRFNNNREWFGEHKEEYQKYLFEPMKALAASVGEAFMGEDGTKLHLSRIYRDMRMHPSTFYKESLWFCIRRPGASWLEQPGLCFEIRPEGYRFGFLLIHPKAATMELLRIKMADHSEEFLKIVKQAEKESGLKLTGDTYARQKPCPKEELVEIELKNDVLKVDGNMAIAWSGSLEFTVERSGKTLIGSAASGEGLVNVYRGTGRVLLAPVSKGLV